MRERDQKEFNLDEWLEQARSILSSDGQDLRSVLYREIVLNALKCKRDDLDVLDLKVVNRALAEFRYAAKTFKPYRRVRKVSIFGSARVPEGDPYFEMAVKFSKSLADQGFMVITGAAEGIMRAGIQGATADKSFGVNILLPFESGPTKAFQGDPKLVTFKYFFIRKLFFVMEADACALFPGGFGTHDEGFEVLTLLQTGKAPLMPLLLMELPGQHYWEAWDQFIQSQLLARGYVSPEDLSIYKIIHSPAEGVEWVKSYYSTYHSMRQVRDTLVVRLEKELREEHLDELSESFKDIVSSGGVVKTSALAQEADEPELVAKPRIAFRYNHKSAGRLNQMVLEINRMGRSV